MRADPASNPMFRSGETRSLPDPPIPYRPARRVNRAWQTGWSAISAMPRAHRCPEFQYAVLKEPLKIAANHRHLVASTQRTDGDFVVKLIDVYPTRSAAIRKWALSADGSADILRGPYRDFIQRSKADSR